jgi:anti-sigma regulatory factor (Ser/Thr protein kinase)
MRVLPRATSIQTLPRRRTPLIDDDLVVKLRTTGPIGPSWDSASTSNDNGVQIVMDRREHLIDEDHTARVGNQDREAQSFINVPDSARAARAFIARTLRNHGATSSVVEDFELIVGELAANAIEHGDGPNLYVTVDFTDARWWDVEISGASGAVDEHVLDPLQWQIAGPEAESGRGLGITRALVDDIVTSAEPHWLSIRCRRRVARAPSSSTD